MRFLLGLLAALFSVSSVPASAATAVLYKVTGYGSVSYTFGGPTVETGFEAYFTLIDSVLPYSAYCAPYSICSGSANNLTVRTGSDPRYSSGEFQINLTFDEPTSITPPEAADFVSGTLSWIYGDVRDGSFRQVRGIITGISATRTEGGSSDAPFISLVPEPATWAMIVGGFALIGTAMRRQRHLALA